MATEILRPNAAGDETNVPYEYPADEVHWTLVDESTPDEDSTYIKGFGNTFQRDLYNLPAHSGSGTINFIKVYTRCKDTGSEPVQTNLKIAIKTGGTVYESSEITTTLSYVDYSNQWNTNPSTGSAWTWDEIDALQIGAALRAGYIGCRCTQVYVEIDYTGVTEKESSDTGSGADAVDSLETPEAKSSSDAGSGVEGTPIQSAILAVSETGFSIEALTSRLLAAVDTGGGAEASSVEKEGTLKSLFATELGEGSDSLVAKIEKPIKGGGMKLWT